jgi:uncharacterized membrane protein
MPKGKDMADNIIVAIFSSVDPAYETAKAIIDLKDAPGSGFKFKSGIIVTKDARGEVSVLETESHPFRGMKVGAVVGGLIGLIGGAPIAAIGALLGSTLGAIGAAGTAILTSATVSSIKDAMHPGTVAVIIEAEEDSPKAIDDIVSKQGGRVFREAARGPIA